MVAEGMGDLLGDLEELGLPMVVVVVREGHRSQGEGHGSGPQDQTQQRMDDQLRHYSLRQGSPKRNCQNSCCECLTWW